MKDISFRMYLSASSDFMGMVESLGEKVFW
jgi:hypothetical protein